MFFLKAIFFSSLYIFFINFSKKLISLLSLELMMIIFILSLFFVLKNCPHSLFPFCLILLIMMVLDSVLGISLLIFSCRFTSKINFSFF